MKERTKQLVKIVEEFENLEPVDVEDIKRRWFFTLKPLYDLQLYAMRKQNPRLSKQQLKEQVGDGLDNLEDIDLILDYEKQKMVLSWVTTTNMTTTHKQRMVIDIAVLEERQPRYYGSERVRRAEVEKYLQEEVKKISYIDKDAVKRLPYEQKIALLMKLRNQNAYYHRRLSDRGLVKEV
jgi:hypothetical protein